MEIFKTISQWPLSQIASFFGGLLILIYAVSEVFKKVTENTDWAKKRKEKRNKEKYEAAHKQYQEFTDAFVKEFVPPLVKQLETADQEIINKLDNLIEASKDMLRKEMTDIYYEYLPYKKILQYDKKCFIKLYHDYGALKGNTYIDEIWAEIQTWEVVLESVDLGEPIKKENK